MNLPAKQTSSLAIVSLVFGILGVFLPIGIASIVAIVTGHMARAEIRRSPDTIEGDGFAVAGLVLGWGMIALGALMILLAILFFGGIAVLLGWLGINGYLN